MLVCTLGVGGGGGSEKVYCLYTHENVDIFGWPLMQKQVYIVHQCHFIPLTDSLVVQLAWYVVHMNLHWENTIVYCTCI